MKQTLHISGIKKSLVLFFGILTAFLVVLSGPIQKGLEVHFSKHKICQQIDKEVESGKTNESKKAEIKVQSYDAIIPAVQFQPIFFSNLIIELPFFEKEENKSTENQSVPLVNSLFKVLFGRIIAPNAP